MPSPAGYRSVAGRSDCGVPVQVKRHRARLQVAGDSGDKRRACGYRRRAREEGPQGADSDNDDHQLLEIEDAPDLRRTSRRLTPRRTRQPLCKTPVSPCSPRPAARTRRERHQLPRRRLPCSPSNGPEGLPLRHKYRSIDRCSRAPGSVLWPQHLEGLTLWRELPGDSRRSTQRNGEKHGAEPDRRPPSRDRFRTDLRDGGPGDDQCRAKQCWRGCNSREGQRVRLRGPDQHLRRGPTPRRADPDSDAPARRIRRSGDRHRPLGHCEARSRHVLYLRQD